MTSTYGDSISDTEPVAGDSGQLSHPELAAHSDRLIERFYACGKNAWSYVGNGLSNQTFIRGPEGIIAIDTGECIEEMQSALAQLRAVTDEPVVACIYTHFHYINGTRAILEESGRESLPIYGHAGIAANLMRFGGEVAPRSTRGLVRQFAIGMPEKGEDGQVNVGLGRFFRNPGHSPHTSGYLPVTDAINEPCTMTIAGLEVEMTPAPSDATDSITIWFPELGVCVNNLVWPALFNVFAIRGEEYRDPRVLLKGLDHLAGLPVDHLLGAHGPPLSGRADIAGVIEDYGDSIRFMWDQTVRGINKGLSLDELAASIRLPQRFTRTYFTRQFYGVVEHHVRQIHAGLFGWFDEDDAHLFPLAPHDRAARMIEGFGGIERVRHLADAACYRKDYRWAIELAGWLVRTESAQEDRNRLATALRGVGQHSTSANVRNWCITRALELEGAVDLERFRQHRFGYREVLAAPATAFVPVLRVLLDPDRASGIDMELGIAFDSGEQAGLRIRGQVAIPTTGDGADATMRLDHDCWAKLLSRQITPAQAVDEKLIAVEGDADTVKEFLAAFDVFN